MNLKVGIVGLPNAGKSTLFNALLKKQIAEVANYPFTTIEPNVGVVPVPDVRLEVLAKLVREENRGQALEDKRPDPESQSDPSWPPIVAAIVQFVDIAGLVKGASEGQGLGNKFLAHIREVDLIVNVLRFFEDSSVIHVAGDVDPERDREIIETELILADLQTLGNQKIKSTTIQQLIDALNHEIPAREVGLTDEQVRETRDLHLLTMKPVLYVANVAEQQLNNSPFSPSYTKRGLGGVTGGEGELSHIAISAKIEAELASLSDEEQKAYLKELGLEASGLDRLIQKAYEMLGLISFLTQGIKEVRAWTIAKGMKAQQAAGVIHTDFEKKFIKAEVIGFHELVVVGGWKKAKEVGKLRMEGRHYEMADGDVVEFKIGS